MGLRVVIGADDSFSAPIDLHSRALGEPSAASAAAMLEHILARQGKSLSGQIRDALLERGAGGGNAVNPLWLSMAATELMLMNADDFADIAREGGGIDAICRHQLALVNAMPMPLEQMSHGLLRAVCAAISPQAWSMACCIAVSRYGLRESDLEALLSARGEPWRPLDLSRLVNTLPELFVIRDDGRVDFRHTCLRQGMRAALRESGGLRPAADSLAALLAGLPKGDPIRVGVWEALADAGCIDRIVARCACDIDERDARAAADALADWLFGFATPAEAGYLESEEFRLEGSEVPEPLGGWDLLMAWLEAQKRPSAADPASLPEPLQGRVAALAREIAALTDAGDADRSAALLGFMCRDFCYACRRHPFDGREYAKRAVAALFADLARRCFASAAFGAADAPGPRAIMGALAAEAMRALGSTGYFQDREEAERLLAELRERMPPWERRAEDAWTMLRAVAACAEAVAGDEEDAARACELFQGAQEIGYRCYNMARNGCPGATDDLPFNLLELRLMLARIQLGLARLPWKQDDMNWRRTREELMKASYACLTQEDGDECRSDAERDDLRAEEALLQAQHYEHLADMVMQDPRGADADLALSMLENGRNCALRAIELGGETIPRQYWLYRLEARRVTMRMLAERGISPETDHLFQELYRSVDKWRRATGCRESLLVKAELHRRIIAVRQSTWKSSSEYFDDREMLFARCCEQKAFLADPPHPARFRQM